VATNSDSDSARVAASIALLDRAYGRPRQALEHSVHSVSHMHLSALQIVQKERLEARQPGSEVTGGFLSRVSDGENADNEAQESGEVTGRNPMTPE
jgi:hypothetical protein